MKAREKCQEMGQQAIEHAQAICTACENVLQVGVGLFSSILVQFVVNVNAAFHAEKKSEERQQNVEAEKHRIQKEINQLVTYLQFEKETHSRKRLNETRKPKRTSTGRN